MTFFILSLLALFIAPPLHYLVKGLGRHILAIEKITLICMAIIVAGHIFPESFSAAGWWAVLALAIGILLPTLLEKALHHDQMHLAMVILITVGLAMHGFLDGAALGLSYQMGADLATGLPLAVVLHRIPAALFLWWMLRPKGAFVGWGVLMLLGATTCFGFLFATADVINLRDQTTLGVFQALVGGSLVHLAIHRPNGHLNHSHSHAHS